LAWGRMRICCCIVQVCKSFLRSSTAFLYFI
jgi:hypothetical protein